MITDDSGYRPFFLHRPRRLRFKALNSLDRGGIGYGGYLSDWTYIDLEVCDEWVWRCWNENLAALSMGRKNEEYHYSMNRENDPPWRPGDAELVAAHSPWDRRDGKPVDLESLARHRDILASHERALAALALSAEKSSPAPETQDASRIAGLSPFARWTRRCTTLLGIRAQRGRL